MIFRGGVSKMELFKYRGLAIGCLGYLILLYISYYVHIAITISIAIFGIVLFIFLGIRYKRARRRQIKSHFIRFGPLCILLVVATIVSFFTFHRDKQYYYLCDDTERIISGKIDSVVYSEKYFGSYILDIEAIDGSDKRLTVAATDNLGTLKENDIIVARAKFRRPALMYHQDDGIFLECDISEYTSIEAGKVDLLDYLRKANRFLDNIFKNELNSDTYPVFSALFLGNRSSLDPAIERDFARLGISHVLSLSGMHVSIIITLVGLFVFNVINSRRLQIILMCLIVFVFVGISGFSGSALRSGLMQIIFFSLHFLWRRSDSISALFFAVFVVCLINPYSVFSFSLLLSFLAMLGCIASAKYVRKRRIIFRRVRGRIPRFIVLTFISTTFVLLMTIPLTSNKFGTFSYLTYISNMVIVPFINILIYLAPLVLIFSPVPYISEGINFICENLTFAITKVCSLASSLPSIVIPVKNVLQILGTIILFASILILMIVSRRKIKYSYITAILGISIFVIGSIILPISRATSSQIVTSQGIYGDTVFIENQNKLIAVDITSYSKSEITPYYEMSRLGYAELHSYIACEYNHKTSSYIEELTGRALVRNVYLPMPITEKDHKFLSDVSEILDKRGVNYSLYQKELNIKGIKFNFAEKCILGDSTKRSVCFSFLINKTRYTYLGASSYELPDYFPLDYAKGSDIVAFGSYGPNRSLIFDYPVSDIDYLIYLGESYNYSSEQMKSSFTGKEIRGGYVKIKIKNR